MYYGRYDPRNVVGPLCGPDQTAPRAEAVAAAPSICRATSKVTIVTDSSGVRRKVQRIVDNHEPSGKHQEAWTKVWHYRFNVHAVPWVKTHLEGEEAVARARTEGYPSQKNDLNTCADTLEGTGVSQHEENPSDDALRRWRK